MRRLSELRARCAALAAALAIGGRWARSPAETEERRRLEALVGRLADELYRRALADGGWAVEIGFLGPKAFVGEASRVLDEVALGNGQDGPPTP